MFLFFFFYLAQISWYLCRSKSYAVVRSFLMSARGVCCKSLLTPLASSTVSPSPRRRNTNYSEGSLPNVKLTVLPQINFHAMIVTNLRGLPLSTREFSALGRVPAAAGDSERGKEIIQFNSNESKPPND